MKMKKDNYLTFTFRIFLALFFASFLFLPHGCYKVLAANCLDTAERQAHCKLVSWNASVLASGSGIQDEEPTPDFSSLPTFTNPMDIDSPQTFIGKIINIIMGVVGSIALIMFIFGGITWMMAGGNEQKVKKGVGILVWSVIGLVAIFLSYAIVNILLKQVA